jgi:hypothetical protein
MHIDQRDFYLDRIMSDKICVSIVFGSYAMCVLQFS